MKTKTMQIKLDGEQHQIDANTLINCLIHYTAIVTVANEELGQGEKKVTLKVNALKEGSFIIDMSICEEFIRSLFSRDTVDYLSGLVTVVGGTWAAYKFLKGKDIDKDKAGDILNQININNTDNVINKTIINVYNRKEAREAIKKTFETVEHDENVEGLRISGEGIDNVDFRKEEFESMCNDEPIETVERKKTECKDVNLTILSMSFEKGGMWQFMYDGFKIKCSVKDDELMKLIDKGERFGKGDAIKAKLQIEKVYNESYHAYENKKYNILEFKEHMKAPQQGELFTE